MTKGRTMMRRHALAAAAAATLIAGLAAATLAKPVTYATPAERQRR